ncbi:MAG: HAD family hydrolase [Candidatus Heimdallarchaeaceae archaeon]
MKYIYPYSENSVKELIKKVSTLLIDFDGTLVHYPENARKALDELFSKHGVTKNLWSKARKDYEKINNELWAKFELKEYSLEQVRRIRFEKLKQLYDLSGKPEKIDEEYLRYLIKNTTVDERTLTFLRQLRDVGYKLYIVTNGIHDVQVGRLNNTRIIDFVDGFATSEQIGTPKPHSPIFEYALRETQTPPEQAFLVGDSYEADIIGAYNMNINSCLIANNNKNIAWKDGKKPVMIVKDFNEFAEFCVKNK